MSATRQRLRERLRETEPAEIATTLRNAGLAGAGGAGFPTYAKWERLNEVDHLLVNHQESEPNYYMDKWLGREHADELTALFEALLDRSLDTVVVAAKAKDRAEWMEDLERATDGRVYMPEDLPVNPDEESGIVFAYTDDQYEYGMETVILRMVADTVIGNDLPMDHGFIVQNTETLYNVYRALEDDTPATRKFVHVDGDVHEHRFLEVPIGTPASALLTAAGTPPRQLTSAHLLADGGPGWCFEIGADPARFGVRKRSNCLLVLDESTARENTLGNDRIQVLNEREWPEGDHEREPSATLSPSYVRVPLISNPSFEGVVSRSQPIVEPGDEVAEGEMIARPAGDGVSAAQHASIDGTVTEVTDTHVEIEQEDAARAAASEGRATPERMLYWTWCLECGKYVVYPETDSRPRRTDYVCQDCR